MADPPSAPNRFLAGMRRNIREEGVVNIPESSYFWLNVNNMEQIEEFVEALLDIGPLKGIEIEVGHEVYRGPAATHRGLDRLCEALRATCISTVSLIGGDARDGSYQWQQADLTSTFLRKGAELFLMDVRVDETLALVLQECANLTHVEFCKCHLVHRGALNPVVEAMRQSKVESLVFAEHNPLTPFEADVLAAARDFTKLNLKLWPNNSAERVFFGGNRNELESLTISFSRCHGREIASRRLGSTLNLIRESPIRIHNVSLIGDDWNR